MKEWPGLQAATITGNCSTPRALKEIVRVSEGWPESCIHAHNVMAADANERYASRMCSKESSVLK